MFFRQILNDETACASYLFGCKTHAKLAVVDPHADLVDEYVTIGEAQGAPIVAVLETHVHADHLSGLPGLVERTGAVAYLPEGADVDFDHRAMADGEGLELGNTAVRAGAPPASIGLEGRPSSALGFESEEAFAASLVEDTPPAPEGQAARVAANRAGRAVVETR